MWSCGHWRWPLRTHTPTQTILYKQIYYISRFMVVHVKLLQLYIIIMLFTGVNVQSALPCQLMMRVCCQEIAKVVDKLDQYKEVYSTDTQCITQYPGFDAAGINEWVLEIAYLQYKQQPLHQYVYFSITACICFQKQCNFVTFHHHHIWLTVVIFRILSIDELIFMNVFVSGNTDTQVIGSWCDSVGVF